MTTYTASAGTERDSLLIQDYRTRLTTEVVSRKLDVRPLSACLTRAGAAADLPALAAESSAPPEPGAAGDESKKAAE